MKTLLRENCPNTEFFLVRSSHRRCSIKKVFLEFSLYSQENTCVESCFNKVAGLKACDFIKKRLQHRCFSVNIARFIRKPILKNISEWLLLSRPFSRSELWELGDKYLKRWQYRGLNDLYNILTLCCELWTNLYFYDKVVLTEVNNVWLNKICSRT